MGDKGFFGGLFDFNGDGKLDDFERAVDFAAFMSIIDDEENDNSDDESDDFDSDCDDDDYDDDTFDDSDYDD